MVYAIRVVQTVRALNLPIILVTGSYLGTLSHTLSAIYVILRRNLRIAAIVLNESPESPVPLEETAATLRRHMSLSPASAAPVMILPRPAELANHATFAALADTLLTIS